jgi:hypothetical protein
MFPTKLLASLTLVAAVAVVGCTTSHGRIYQSADWTAASGHSLGRVLVIVPKFRTDLGEDQPARDEKIQSAIRAALAEFPATSVIDQSETTLNHTTATATATATAAREGPISEAQAIAAGQALDAQTVCIVTPGQFGGRYLLSLLPPGWDLRTSVQYAVRLIDVKSGAVLVDSVRERTSGGYLAIMAASYRADLKDDLSFVLASKR